MHYVRRLQVALTGSPYLDFELSNHFVSTIIINIHIMYRTPTSQWSPPQLLWVYEERFNHRKEIS